MKKIIIPIMIMYLISLVGAMYNITAGESIIVPLQEQFEYFSIIGNSTPINLNLTQDGLNVTIMVSKYQKTDKFEILFFNKEKEIINHYSGGRSGGESPAVYYINTIYKNITIYKNKTNEQEQEEVKKEDFSKKKIFLLLISLLIILSLFLFICLVIIKSRLKKLKKQK